MCSHHNLHIKLESLEVTHPPLDSFNKGWWIVSKWQFRKIRNSPLYCFEVWCTRAVLCSVKVVFACKRWGSITPLRNGEKCLVTTGIYSSCCILMTFWRNSAEKQSLAWARGGGMPTAEWVAIFSCGAEEGLHTDPPRVSSQEWLTGGGITWTHLRWLSSPASICRWLGETQLSRYLAVTCTLFYLSLPFSFWRPHVAPN